MGVVGSPWNIIVFYIVQKNEMRTYQKQKDLCILNKNFEDDTLNPVLRASFCWTFRTHAPQFWNPDPRPPDFKLSNLIEATAVADWSQHPPCNAFYTGSRLSSYCLSFLDIVLCLWLLGHVCIYICMGINASCLRLIGIAVTGLGIPLIRGAWQILEWKNKWMYIHR